MCCYLLNYLCTLTEYKWEGYLVLVGLWRELRPQLNVNNFWVLVSSIHLIPLFWNRNQKTINGADFCFWTKQHKTNLEATFRDYFLKPLQFARKVCFFLDSPKFILLCNSLFFLHCEVYSTRKWGRAAIPHLPSAKVYAPILYITGDDNVATFPESSDLKKKM